MYPPSPDPSSIFFDEAVKSELSNSFGHHNPFSSQTPFSKGAMRGGVQHISVTIILSLFLYKAFLVMFTLCVAAVLIVCFPSSSSDINIMEGLALSLTAAGPFLHSRLWNEAVFKAAVVQNQHNESLVVLQYVIKATVHLGTTGGVNC